MILWVDIRKTAFYKRTPGRFPARPAHMPCPREMLEARPAEYTHTPNPTPTGTHCKTLVFSTSLAKKGVPCLICLSCQPLETKVAVMGVCKHTFSVDPLFLLAISTKRKMKAYSRRHTCPQPFQGASNSSTLPSSGRLGEVASSFLKKHSLNMGCL